MVIGVEGNVHVGKTTYINNNFKDYNILSEIKFQADMTNFNRQLYYIEEEIKRKSKLQKNSILDRTIISIIIYTKYTSTLSLTEKRKIMNIIKKALDNNQIIKPDIHLILYPYKLLSVNHQDLKEVKKTQDSLVDYDYYLNYSLFFANRKESLNKIINYHDYREIISYKKDIFNLVTNKKRIRKRTLIENDKANNNSNTKDIINKINDSKEKSFLNDLIILLSNKSKERKLSIIDKIMSKVPLNNYVTKIICLSKNDNIIKFYKVLNDRLGNMSNISFNKDNSHKPLLLIDLFYEIKEAIKEGEI